MYSYEDHVRAVELYLKLGKRVNSETGEHGAAASGRAATAAVVIERFPAPDVWYFQRIVDEQFFSRGDASCHLNENPPAFFDGLAVRIAGMIEPASAVAAAPAIDHATVRQPEKKCVSLDFAVRVVTRSFAPRSHQAQILQNTLAGGQRLECKDAFAMDGRASDGDTFHRWGVCNLR